MPYAEMTDEQIRSLLADVRTIALVGASDNPDRPSHDVMAFLLRRGFDVRPVNPALAGKDILGRKVAASLSDLGAPVDMVDIFRNAEAAGDVVDEAIACGAKVVWMQLEVVNHEAAERALAAGLKVVMNRCPHIELGHYGAIPSLGRRQERIVLFPLDEIEKEA